MQVCARDSALNSSGGRERIDDALMNIDAEHAYASVETDREFILAIVQRDMALARLMSLFEMASSRSTATFPRRMVSSKGAAERRWLRCFGGNVEIFTSKEILLPKHAKHI